MDKAYYIGEDDNLFMESCLVSKIEGGMAYVQFDKLWLIAENGKDVSHFQHPYPVEDFVFVHDTLDWGYENTLLEWIE